MAAGMKKFQMRRQYDERSFMEPAAGGILTILRGVTCDYRQTGIFVDAPSWANVVIN
jgi:hypothetical protein